MTQPQAQPPLLARRVGPLPVWIWFLLLVLLLAGFIWWRKRRAMSEGDDGGSDASSMAIGSPGGVLTSDLPTILPFFPQELDITIHRPEDDQDDTVTPPSTPPTKPPTTSPPKRPPPSTTPPPKPTAPKPRVPSGKINLPVGKNLYDWAYTMEQKYTVSKPVFKQLQESSMAKFIKWGSPSKFNADPKYGNVPHITAPHWVKLK